MSKILVVDDERAVRYSFDLAFREDYAVIASDSGLDALEKLEKESPDIVVMDIKMPGMNGVETLRRTKERAPNTPVIMMTAFGDTDTAIEAMEEGAYDYVTKPFENSELRRIIEKGLASAALFRDAVCFGSQAVSEHRRQDSREEQRHSERLQTHRSSGPHQRACAAHNQRGLG